MIPKIIKSRLLFFWISSFVMASTLYYVLWFIMPGHRVFGSMYRMFLYHYGYPLQYIAIPCFFYGIIASALSKYYSTKKRMGRILLTLLIITVTILFSSPFGGMLWQYHDMMSGYFPINWESKLITEGFEMGLGVGWFIILLSFPYNILGTIVCYFLTKKGVELYSIKYKTI